ncbi:MAG: transcription-repair coupling factor, partial [Epsilonproteobacteria bacterium]|nr:transcription-repair coupling factor [Campylobacterota bacterium]
YYFGYSFVDLVSAKGEVSFRGDILDIYPPNASYPFRVIFFGDEIEEISAFDISTQRRIKKDIESIEIFPSFLSLDKKSFKELEERVKNSHFDPFVKDIYSIGFWHLDNFATSYLKEFKSSITPLALHELREYYSLNNPIISLDEFPSTPIEPLNRYIEIKSQNINELIKNNKDHKVIVVAKSEAQLRGSSLIDLEDINFIKSDGVINIKGDNEIIISLNKENKPKRVKRAKIILDEIKVGEYVVHENHGIGIFRGIQKREVLGAVREFVVLEYQNSEYLYIPVENLDVIDRYIASSGSLPVVDKLGKSSFKRIKEKAKEKLFAIASELINISANRLLQKGAIFNTNIEELLIFQKEAGFEYTPDQKRVIKEIIQDLSSGRVMDRLLSADVGFGKTEIAMNAIFLAIKSGYQAALIAPTTLLVSQHFNTFKERFLKWGIRVEKLDRFTSTKNKKEILKDLEEGNIDCIIGTHALLGVKFKNLGLVVIDEEHKFGVKQKEAIKKISLNTHLLSMSATPIPRTLNMALSKIKSFSEILTPPLDRKGVRTFVKSYDKVLVKEAILRELRRGGQIFYIYNSISAIESKKEELLELLPDLKIAILHSKVPAAKSERELLKFANGEYDLLLSTSIVESGLHLPNANSIIVDGAQNFGIADLHQLRGRVGRGEKEGYAYFFVDNKENLSDSAKRRLLALESHSSLGSGAILAMHDLEIRGGGNLIGEAQSGHIKQIGYSLYLKMLEDAIKKLSGEAKDLEKEIEIALNVNAYLNDELISEDRLRLELYRRLSQASNVEEIYEIEEEIEDRFGKLDKISRQFIDLMIIKVLAKNKNIKRISSFKEKIFIEFYNQAERLTLKAPTKDDDDVIKETLSYLRSLK